MDIVNSRPNAVDPNGAPHGNERADRLLQRMVSRRSRYPHATAFDPVEWVERKNLVVIALQQALKGRVFAAKTTSNSRSGN
jgi:hypothetical protein